MDFEHEYERQTKFESAIVQESYSGQAYDCLSGDRAYARTQTGRVAGPKFRPGDNIILFASAEHDQPIIVGGSPYLT
ncbi:MAG: hypothetical protein E6Q97_15150 [Desulfurellales bacterium]|nr:MAG: hypothetical protein E6Q97_15150 [Desulfurellales bacterium]